MMFVSTKINKKTTDPIMYMGIEANARKITTRS